MNDLLPSVIDYSQRISPAPADRDYRPLALGLLKRRDGAGIDVLVGDVVDIALLSDTLHPATTDAQLVLGLIPFRQVIERGFTCHDDGAPLRCLLVQKRQAIPLAEVIARLPTDNLGIADIAGIAGIGFDVDDSAYAELVEQVIADEIGTGQGANFVIRRDYFARFGHVPRGATWCGVNADHVALVLLRRLLIAEPTAYWTFAVYAGDITMVGATQRATLPLIGRLALTRPEC